MFLKRLQLLFFKLVSKREKEILSQYVSKQLLVKEIPVNGTWRLGGPTVLVNTKMTK